MIETLWVVWSAARQYARYLQQSLQISQPSTALDTMAGGGFKSAEFLVTGFVPGASREWVSNPVPQEHIGRDQKLLKIKDRLEKKIISLGGIFTVLPQLTDGLTCGGATNTTDIQANQHKHWVARGAKEVFSSFAIAALKYPEIARKKMAKIIRMFSDDSIPPTGKAPSTSLWEENIPQLYRITKKMYKNTLKKGEIAIDDTDTPTFMNGGHYA